MIEVMAKVIRSYNGAAAVFKSLRQILFLELPMMSLTRSFMSLVALIFVSQLMSFPAFGVGMELGPCATDAAKLCPGVAPGKGAVMQCLRGKADQVSAECRKQFEAKKQQKVEEKRVQRDAGRQACSADIAKFCSQVPIGQGAHFKCLKDNLAQLSAACRTHVETAKNPWK